MPPQLIELLAIMTVAVLGIGFSWMQGDQLFSCIFAVEGWVAAIAAEKWLRSWGR